MCWAAPGYAPRGGWPSAGGAAGPRHPAMLDRVRRWAGEEPGFSFVRGDLERTLTLMTPSAWGLLLKYLCIGLREEGRGRGGKVNDERESWNRLPPPRPPLGDWGRNPACAPTEKRTVTSWFLGGHSTAEPRRPGPSAGWRAPKGGGEGGPGWAYARAPPRTQAAVTRPPAPGTGGGTVPPKRDSVLAPQPRRRKAGCGPSARLSGGLGEALASPRVTQGGRTHLFPDARGQGCRHLPRLSGELRAASHGGCVCGAGGGGAHSWVSSSWPLGPPPLSLFLS